MVALLKKDTLYTRNFLMVYKTDHLTGGTGQTVTVRLSKAGASFSVAGGSVAQVGNGIYSIALTTDDTNTLGDLTYFCQGTNLDDTNFIDQVIGMDLNIPIVTSGTSRITDVTAAGIRAFFLVAGTGYPSAVAGSVVKEIADNAGGSSLTEAGIADAIWDEARAGHVGVGSFGEGAASVQGNVTGSVGSVTGAVGSVTGNVSGSVNSVVSSVTCGTNADKGVRLGVGYTMGTNNDKVGYSLSSGQLFIKKNTILSNFMFLMLDSADHVTPKTGLTITGEVSIDGAAFGALTNSATELANGIYKIDLAAADVNGTNIMLKFTAVGADQRNILIVTQT